jgi:hypothetical protein
MCLQTTTNLDGNSSSIGMIFVKVFHLDYQWITIFLHSRGRTFYFENLTIKSGEYRNILVTEGESVSFLSKTKVLNIRH